MASDDAPIFTETTETETANNTSGGNNPTTETTETETANTDNNTSGGDNTAPNVPDLSDFNLGKQFLNNKYDSLYTLPKVQDEIENFLQNFK